MTRLISVFALLAALVLMVPGVHAQGAQVAFGGLKQDTSLPVEVTANSMTVDQASGSAVFSGDVVIGQGEMRLSGQEVRVDYSSNGQITKVHVTGGVTLVNAGEAAEAREAVYTIDDGQVVMSGNVILTQGNNALSGQRLVVNLTAGTGRMEGRVKTIFQPQSNQ